MRTSPRTHARLARWGPLFALAALVRGAYWAFVTPDWRPVADADQYVRIARALADGHGFSLVFPQLEMHATAFRPPLYPLVLTPGALVFGDALWPARLVNLLIGSVVAVLAGVVAARVAGRVAGVVAGVVVALYPPLIANDTVTLTEPLALALLLAAILLADDDRWAWSGIAVGALLLTRPNGYLVVPILGIWAWRRLGWRHAGALVGCVVLVVAPWLVRNRVQVGTWRLTTSDGFTMAAMWGLPAQQAGTFVDPVFSARYGDADHRLAQFDEAGWNEKLSREALEAIRAHPRYLRHLVDRNVHGYFELRTEYNRYPEHNDGRDWGFRQATLPLFFLVTTLGVAGLLARRRDRRVVVLAAITAQFVVLSLVLVAPPRLRAPFDLAMCIGAGLFAAAVADRLAGRSSASTKTIHPLLE